MWGKVDERLIVRRGGASSRGRTGRGRNFNRLYPQGDEGQKKHKGRKHHRHNRKHGRKHHKKTEEANKQTETETETIDEGTKHHDRKHKETETIHLTREDPDIDDRNTNQVVQEVKYERRVPQSHEEPGKDERKTDKAEVETNERSSTDMIEIMNKILREES